MLIQNFYYYLANQEELVKNYNGKHLVISNNKVIYSAPDYKDALQEGVQRAGVGNFIVQLCTPGESAYTAKCYTPGVRITNALTLC
jgi:hypothetical protein